MLGQCFRGGGNVQFSVWSPSHGFVIDTIVPADDIARSYSFTLYSGSNEVLIEDYSGTTYAHSISIQN